MSDIPPEALAEFERRLDQFEADARELCMLQEYVRALEHGTEELNKQNQRLEEKTAEVARTNVEFSDMREELLRRRERLIELVDELNTENMRLIEVSILAGDDAREGFADMFKET